MEFEKLQKIIAEVLNIDTDKITMESTFVDDLGGNTLSKDSEAAIGFFLISLSILCCTVHEPTDIKKAENNINTNLFISLLFLCKNK